MKITPKDKKPFIEAGRDGGKQAARNLTAAQRKERARAAGIASGKARKKKAGKK